MRQWKKVLIKDLGRIVTGHTPPTKEKKFFGDFMPFIKPTDISKDEKYTYHPEQYYSLEAAEKYKSSLIPKGATCVVCIGTIGEKMTMAHCDLFTNQSINSIIPSDDYDPDFVYYLLKYNLGKVKSLNKGTASGREFVSKSTFLEMPIKVCVDRDEQIRIGSVLSHYDSLIENYQQQIKLLEEAAQRLYKEWFVDLHFPGYENTKIVDGVPEGWEKKNINEIYSFNYGKNLSTKFIKAKGEFPVYGANGIIGFYSEANCHEKVILVTSRGNGSGDIHRTDQNNSFVTNNSFMVRPNNSFEYCHNPFTYYFLKQANFRLVRTGAAQPQLTNSSINTVTVVLPEKKQIEKFCMFTNSVFDAIDVFNKQLRLLTEARDRLLPKLMSSEIEV